MPKLPPNHGKPWTDAEVLRLLREIHEDTPTHVIGLRHGRMPDAIYAKASELDLSLKPTNQSS